MFCGLFFGASHRLHLSSQILSFIIYVLVYTTLLCVDISIPAVVFIIVLIIVMMDGKNCLQPKLVHIVNTIE
jgi:hypothetical protein